jgi:ribosomal protein S12 methylthiotransferase accessory factor YcaO
MRGNDFNSNKVASAIASGVAAKLADALMAALGSRFESLSSEDVTAIFELYEATLSVVAAADAVEVPEASNSVAEQQAYRPSSPYEAGGDEAAGSPAASCQ